MMAFSTCSASSTVSSIKTNPIEKVIEMLGDLQQKVIGEGEAAQKTYDEFAEWCEDTARNIQFDIKTAKGEVESLKATIQEAASVIAEEEEKIGQLSSQIATDEADLKAATAIREKENGIFVAQEKELMEAVDILSRAVGILERELGAGASLAQMQHTVPGVLDSLKQIITAAKINDVDTSKLSALLQTQHQSASAEHDELDDFMLGAPDPAVFKSNAGGIVATINDLLEDAKTELEEARKKEITNKHNYELLKLELDDAIAFANKQLDKAKKAKAEAAETKSVAEGDLAVTTKGLAETMKQLGSIHHDCMSKAEEFEITTKSRGEELKALAEAKKIIIEATGGAASQTYGLDQTGSSFLQTSASSSSEAHIANANQEAVKFIRNLAHKLHSPSLTQLAQRVQAAARYVARYGTRAGEDPFAKVKGLIKDMIAKLLKEAEAEASHKAFCDKEMSETKTKKEDLGDEIEKLTAKIDKASAESAKLKDEVKTLQKELADLEKSQAEMDKIREEENTQYKADKEEMEQGLEGIKLALKVLREYYGQDAAHGSATGAGGGIISMLEVIESDFTKGLEEMITAEEMAAAEYKQQTKENDITKVTKTQDVKYKTKEFKSLDAAVAEATSDRTALETELNAVLDYYESLKKQCIAKPESYEERKKRREAEIAGLKEALEILNGAAVFLQNGQPALRGVNRHQ
jgi:peptidoglycan hydrolase CwlO-like protein